FGSGRGRGQRRGRRAARRRIRASWSARPGRDARRPPGDPQPPGPWNTGSRSAPGAMSLTFFFSDIEDSTGLLGRLGDAYPEALADSRALIRAAVAQEGGREVDCRGDEHFCVFERPEAGAAAAVSAQQALTAHTWPDNERVRVRIGLHCGEAESKDDDYVGIDVHRASRICQAAHGGQVLASVEVASAAGPLARDLGTFEFR